MTDATFPPMPRNKPTPPKLRLIAVIDIPNDGAIISAADAATWLTGRLAEDVLDLVVYRSVRDLKADAKVCGGIFATRATSMVHPDGLGARKPVPDIITLNRTLGLARSIERALRLRLQHTAAPLTSEEQQLLEHARTIIAVEGAE